MDGTKLDPHQIISIFSYPKKITKKTFLLAYYYSQHIVPNMKTVLSTCNLNKLFWADSFSSSVPYYLRLSTMMIYYSLDLMENGPMYYFTTQYITIQRWIFHQSQSKKKKFKKKGYLLGELKLIVLTEENQKQNKQKNF
jgi:hypothetical protein